MNSSTTTISTSTLAQTIQQRRTIREFKPDQVSISKVMELLNISSWAPNHGNREPWNFILFEKEGRKKLVDAIVATLKPEKKEEQRPDYENYILNSPLQIVVTIPKNEKLLVWEEDLCATAAFIQNFQLLAWEEKIGMVWKTGEMINKPAFKDVLGVSDQDRIVGLLIIGYFDESPDGKKRTNIEEKISLISEYEGENN